MTSRRKRRRLLMFRRTIKLILAQARGGAEFAYETGEGEDGGQVGEGGPELGGRLDAEEGFSLELQAYRGKETKG